jgi:hypothetical protein
MLERVLSRIAVIVVGAALAGCTFQGPGGAATDASTDSPPDTSGGIDTGGRVVDEHLVAVWRFDDGDMFVRDSVKRLRPTYTVTPLDLKIEAATGFQWVPGGLQIDGPAAIRSELGARPHLASEVNTSGAVTLELWVTPADGAPAVAGPGFAPPPPAPGTLFTFGAGPSNCNLRINQTDDKYQGCAKTTMTNRGPEKLIQTPAASAKKGTVQHLVLVADIATRAFYVDGVRHDAPGGDLAKLASWIDTFRITIGDEVMSGTPWLGRIWFAAVYDRVLTPEEIKQNRAAGHDCSAC